MKWLVFISILTVGCVQNDVTEKENIKIIIPDTSKTQQTNYAYHEVRNLRRELNLKNLELGVDSIEIRVYEEVALFEPHHLIIIKYESGIWNSTLITYRTHIPLQSERKYDSTKSENGYYNNIVDSTETKNLLPDISWNTLMDSLRLYNIFNLPSQQEIKGFMDGVNDGVGYHFEVATKKRYKFYTYHCPDLFNDPDNKKATNILKLISRHLTKLWMCKYD